MNENTKTKASPKINMEEVLQQLPSLFTKEHIEETCLFRKGVLYINVNGKTIQTEAGVRQIDIKPFLLSLGVRLEYTRIQKWYDQFIEMDNDIINEERRDKIVMVQRYRATQEAKTLFAKVKELAESVMEKSQQITEVYFVGDPNLAEAFPGDIRWFDERLSSGRYRLECTARHVPMEGVEVVD
jgi:hypothetical protein